MKVAIIGAGASGLSATKACLDEGLNPVCFESSSSLGGLWHYRDNTEKHDQPRGSVFQSTTTIFSRELFCFSDFVVPDEFPIYLHNTDVQKYLSLYADRFGIRECIQFDTVVEKVCHHGHRSSYATGQLNGISDKEWMVRLRDLRTGDIWEDHFDAVIVCTGHHSDAYIPDIKGLSSFNGELLHTRDYRTPRGFEDKTVLVIGAGNSGADVAAEIGNVAKKVYLSTRRGTWIVNRYQQNGCPTDIFFSRRILNLVPAFIKNIFFKYVLTQNFNYQGQNLLPRHTVLSAYPTINDDFVRSIESGMVNVKPDVLQFTQNGVLFQDGSLESVDCIMFATGYKFRIKFLDNSILPDQNGRFYKHVFPVDACSSTLAFIGLVQPWGALNSVAEIQSRWVAWVFKGSSYLPSKYVMVEDVERVERIGRDRFVSSHRHARNVDIIDYVDEIADQFGARPNLFQVFMRDPLLAFMCIVGPCLPYQHRLQGPGSCWKDARRSIMDSWGRMQGQGWTMSMKDIVISSGVCVTVGLLLINLFL